MACCDEELPPDIGMWPWKLKYWLVEGKTLLVKWSTLNLFFPCSLNSLEYTEDMDKETTNGMVSFYISQSRLHSVLSRIWFNLKTCLLISTWSWRRRTMTGNHQNTSSLWVPRWLSWARRKAPTKLRWVLLTLRSALQTCDGCVEEWPQMDTCCYQAHQILYCLTSSKILLFSLMIIYYWW